MEKEQLKEFEEVMMSSEGTEAFDKFIVDYYKKHPKDTFEYPQKRLDELKSDGIHTWTMDDIVVAALLRSPLKKIVKII